MMIRLEAEDTQQDFKSNTTKSDTQQFLQKGLETVEQMMLSQVENYHPDLRAASELILSSSGKRIRPRIILLIGRLLGANYELLLTLATSIELLHTATLVHDDLIDGALLRRGIPTLNSNWSPAATILTGDFLFASASDMASKTNSVEIMRLFSRSLMTIVNGEINQLFTNHCSKDIDGYYHTIYAKTASLFETSTQAAAMISKANTQQIELLRKFGYELGMAFQIVDDILDYTGTEAMIGKPVGEDLRQGLITLPMLYYMKLKPEDLAVQRITAGNFILNGDDIQHFLLAIPKSDAIVKAQEDAARFARKAETCIMNFPDKPERDALVEIARYSIKRKK